MVQPLKHRKIYWKDSDTAGRMLTASSVGSQQSCSQLERNDILDEARLEITLITEIHYELVKCEKYDGNDVGGFTYYASFPSASKQGTVVQAVFNYEDEWSLDIDLKCLLTGQDANAGWTFGLLC